MSVFCLHESITSQSLLLQTLSHWGLESSTCIWEGRRHCQSQDSSESWWKLAKKSCLEILVDVHPCELVLIAGCNTSFIHIHVTISSPEAVGHFCALQGQMKSPLCLRPQGASEPEELPPQTFFPLRSHPLQDLYPGTHCYQQPQIHCHLTPLGAWSRGRA